jgi:excinuclease ABC subunit B
LRHAATAALMSRNDVIIVASVSCIYGLGSPEFYKEISLELNVKENFNRQEIIEKLIEMHYQRSELLSRGKFRATGNILEIMPPAREIVTRIELSDNKISKLYE